MSTTKVTPFPIKRIKLPDKTTTLTDPTILYKCPKCGKEKLCIDIDENYCICNKITNGMFDNTRKSTRMMRIK